MRWYHSGPEPVSRVTAPTLELEQHPGRPTTSPLGAATPSQRRHPGLRTSIRSVRDSGLLLVKAHIDLARAEAAAIAGEVAKVAAFIGIAIVVVLFAINLAIVGTSLFLGEWILGSLGWGVLHGVLLFIAIAVASVLLAVGVSGGRVVGAFAVALIVGILVGVLMALGLPNQAYTSIGESALPGIEPGVRPLLVGVLILGGLGLLLGLIAAFRGAGAGAAVAGLVVGAVIGAISAATPGVQVGAGIGIAVGYLTWIGLMVLDVSRSGIDVEALKAKFIPSQTIETSKETLEWLQSKMPPGNTS